MSKKEKNKNLVKNTEVKLMLNSEAVMSEEFKLINSFKKVFNISEKKRSNMKIWYLDTPSHDLKKENWSVRYRYHENYDFELTFKKRFNFDSRDIKEMFEDEEIKEFLDQDFKPEIDMGFKKQTLSFSYTEKFPMNELFLHLPLDEGKKHAIKSSPELFENWNSHNWGFDILNNATFLGPVTAIEYKSSFEDLDINIEIWKLDNYYPELSFNIPTKKSKETHDKIISLLMENNWLLQEDLLKTQLLYQKYQPVLNV